MKNWSVLTWLVIVKEGDVLPHHRLEDQSLHRGVYAAHGYVVGEVTQKLHHCTANKNNKKTNTGNGKWDNRP